MLKFESVCIKEKAFIDEIYLYSFGKYAFDINSIDMGKLDIKRIKSFIKKFPEKTKRLLERICKI
ncbi:MAG: hypothetical protein N3A00_02375 [Thermodesulfovibrio sp.]|nr:hypothetical protein [Thermodesulfovibrio sp.]